MTHAQTRVWKAPVFHGRVVVTPTGCWEWTGNRNPGGYGRTRYAGDKWYAHRLARFLAFGDLPEATCHRCDNPPCVNPEHLRAGTMSDNQRESWAKGRHSVTLNLKVRPEHIPVLLAAHGSQRLGRPQRLDAAAAACGLSGRTAYRVLHEPRPSYASLSSSEAS